MTFLIPAGLMNFCLNVLMTGTPDKGMGGLRPSSSQEKIFFEYVKWQCTPRTRFYSDLVEYLGRLFASTSSQRLPV